MARNTAPTPIHPGIAFSRCPFETEADRQAIRDQLGRVLESTPFRTSKRYPALLTYVVEKALQNDAEALKERTLGVEVFHRPPQYDTNADPVVRIAASEVRKRLAQYYYDSTHSAEIRIELPSGSYVPEFYTSVRDRLATDKQNAETSPDANLTEQIRAASLGPSHTNVRKMRWPVLVPVACLILGFFGGAIVNRMQNRVSSAPLSGLDEFWRPLVGAPGSVWLCVGESQVTRIELTPNGARNRFASPYPLSSGEQRAYPALNLADSVVLAHVAGLLDTRNKRYSIHGQTETSFSDLAGQPSVLIGSFNNDWTIRLSDQLRFHFEMNRDTGQQWIGDKQKPDEKIGIHSFNLAAPDTSDAYAIISRVRDP